MIVVKRDELAPGWVVDEPQPEASPRMSPGPRALAFLGIRAATWSGLKP